MCFRHGGVKRAAIQRAWINENQYQKFVHALKRFHVSTDTLPSNAQKFSSDRKFQVFSPLFTPSFDFHQQHLTALGDVVIDDYLSDVLADYSLHTGLVLSVNAAKQWTAVFHNHFAMRMFARSAQFAELAIPLSEDFRAAEERPPHTSSSAEEAVQCMARCLSALEARQPGPQRRDVHGTSFMVGTLPCGQSPLGWKFSHFIGALQQTLGPDAAIQVLEAVYQLRGAGNIMAQAASFLLRLIEVYPALNLVEGLLAAQGLPVKYIGKTRLVGLVEDDPATPPGGTEPWESEGRPHRTNAAARKENTVATSDQSRRSGSSVLHLAGFGSKAVSPSSGSVDVTLDTLIKPGALAKASALTLLDGPSALDMVHEWHRRNAINSQGTGADPPVFSPSDGWLSQEKQREAQLGPAFAGAIDVALHHSFADTYGAPDPENGKVVGRVKFKRTVRDPLFYDKLSDMRKGLPLDTEGLNSTEDFLTILQKPHRRLFEVSMMVGQPSEQRLVGRVIAWKYTVARDVAAKAFLAALIHDLQRQQLWVNVCDKDG